MLAKSVNMLQSFIEKKREINSDSSKVKKSYINTFYIVFNLFGYRRIRKRSKRLKIFVYMMHR